MLSILLSDPPVVSFERKLHGLVDLRLGVRLRLHVRRHFQRLVVLPLDSFELRRVSSLLWVGLIDDGVVLRVFLEVRV